MFDTHCHLNFSRFKKNLPDVINRAHENGIQYIVVPGTDIETSQKAIAVAKNNEHIYAAVGIHPHHVYELKNSVESIMVELEKLITSEKVVAIGEVGLDRHVYEQTKYKTYNVDEKFITFQKELFQKQVELAIKYNKSLILHNREAKTDMLPILEKVWDKKLERRTVFHCCEPDEELLQFAKQRQMFIGVDGDITYTPAKQEFVKKIPLDMLVLETDSPFLLPEPLRTQKLFPNEPKNIKLINEFIAQILRISPEELAKQTTANAKKLFSIPD